MTTIIPGRREGQMVALVTDMHAGIAFQNGVSITAEQHAKAGKDIDHLASMCDVIGLGGDNVNWGGSSTTPEDAQIRNWMNARDKSHADYLIVTGNHDHSNSAATASRDFDAWSTATLNAPQYDHAPAGDDASDGVQVVGLSQDTVAFNEWLTPAAAAADSRPEVKPGRGFVLSDNASNPLDTSTAFGYLRARLETGRPTWVLQHYPMPEQMGGSRYVPAETASKFNDIAHEYSNLLGILSGHHHVNVFTNTNMARPYSSGGRTLAGVNGPPCGGQADMFGLPFVATVATYRPGKVIVRWRDVLRRAWIRHNEFGYSREFDVSCTASISSKQGRT